LNGLQWHRQKHQNPPSNLKNPNLTKVQAAIVTREWERNRAIRLRLEKKFAELDKIPDPYADMWDKDWIKKP
jgi:hypothetical protein